MDFTLHTYHKLLKTLKQQGFSFLSFSDFVSEPSDRAIVLRHDVDKLPGNSLRFAGIQAEKGIRGSYYFRIVTESFNENIIKEIYSLGHEIGYHYEDVSLAAVSSRKYVVCSKEIKKNERKIVDIAIESFARNLERLRRIAPVKTICMHGSPLSRWDSRLLWKYYDYRDFGIIGEPYFDVDFDEVLYLTDTGRRWNGESVSIRDRALGVRRQASGGNPFEDWKVKPFKYRDKTIINNNNQPTPNLPLRRDRLSREGNFITEPATSNQQPATALKFHSTSDIIKAAENNQLPDKIMMTFHPQRWTDKPVPWVRELVWQNLKNVGKFFLVRRMR